MRMLRILSTLFLVAAPAAAARAQTVLLEHYEASSPAGEMQSAVCVVPLLGQAAGRARYVCYYAVQGEPKRRDDTNGSGALRTPAAGDAAFGEWLAAALPVGATCDLSALASEGAFPGGETLLDTCRGARYTKHVLGALAPEPFVDCVRGDVTGISATATAVPAPTPQPPPLPVPNPAPPPPPQPPPPPWTDWAILGLLILIALTVEGLAIDRLLQIAQRKQFLSHALAGDEEVGGAATIEQAAIVLAGRRDDEQGKRVAAENALREIETLLGLSSGEDREMRIKTLARYESTVERHGGAVALEAKLAEHKQIEELVRDVAPRGATAFVRDSVALVHGFSRRFWSSTNDPTLALVAVNEVAERVHRLYADFGQQGSHEEEARVELAAVEHALRRLHDQAKAQQEVIEDVQATRRFISAEWPELVTGDLSTTVPHLAQRIRSAQEILPLVREYLMLPEADPASLRALIGDELGSPQRTLRLVLAAAIPELRRNLEAVANAEDANIVRMLRLSEVAAQLELFLRRLDRYRGNELWSTGISSGFSQNWLHDLFRAEAVLRTYFMASSLAELGDVLTLVAWAFRRAIASAGLDVDRVQLLAAPPAVMDPKYGALPEFRTCPDIRNRVQAVLKTQRDGGFAIDVDSVGIRDGNRILKRGAVVLANRIDWED